MSVCSITAVYLHFMYFSTSCALDRPAVHKGYHLKSMLGHVPEQCPVQHTSSEVHALQMKYVIEVCCSALQSDLDNPPPLVPMQ